MKKKKAKHIHKWITDYCDCPNCGGCEERFCEKEGCHKQQMKVGKKWKDC